MHEAPRTLDQMWELAETALRRGVADRKHPARHPVLATVGASGPEQRVLVLRGWSDATARLQTDAASTKVGELQADPRCALHVWVPRQMLQIRLSGRATLSPGAATDWARMPEQARRVYGGTPHPGTPLEGPQEFSPGADPARFLIISIACHRMEVLHLGEDRHLRALFSRAASDWTATWLAP